LTPDSDSINTVNTDWTTVLRLLGGETTNVYNAQPSYGTNPAYQYGEFNPGQFGNQHTNL